LTVWYKHIVPDPIALSCCSSRYTGDPCVSVLLTKCQTPSKRRTDGRTDGRQESNLVHLWHLVAIILMNFLII